MKNLRIAYVINSVEGGGAALPVPAIAQVLRDNGAQVKVFALTGRDRRALPVIEAAGLEPLVRDGGEKDHIAATRWMVKEVQQWGATHIWTSLSRASILGLLIGPRLGLPVISWQHAAFLKPWNARLLRGLQKRALLWVADSFSVAELTAQRLHVSADRLMTWPIYFADPAIPQARCWQAGEDIHIGSLGRLHPVKGYDVLIEALAKLKAEGFAPPAPLRISLTGEGAERERLIAQAAEAGLAGVHLPGYTDNSRGFLSSLHLYVQPSRSEGFCIAAHEALTAGLPVIGSAVGEMRYSINDGENGMIVPPGDATALAARLAELLADPVRMHKMGGAARAHMLDKFSKANFDAAGTAIIDYIRRASA
ncbi:MAG: glycosyltransferase [Sphingobium sp.]|nr:glycosyltransferase [Sphingobium sp.]